ncbi:Hypothetical protein PP7435_CHR2-0044 [Komagataella phaffii CBS 7435]|uniref:Uncharacterized protein n=1 Tax=Komagataella phaffii (strain ATCC 76273 / CBS 7435 / CECT 11047 / NRRL Y-11430 / Wegner 21-1) TaxID=981350 RepID=F2QQR3_KOMPC|nr:Hypothetical protein BQ9382_C2-0222 [Komagataella phaffii CBS 7435]CCA37741.1 Hypothetical protein PP7435_CHR2-0044 [Komagataella phaffii CBS 7435]
MIKKGISILQERKKSTASEHGLCCNENVKPSWPVSLAHQALVTGSIGQGFSAYSVRAPANSGYPGLTFQKYLH